MRQTVALLVFGLIFGWSSNSWAQGDDAAQKAAELSSIRGTEATFTQAFNSGDAAAVAAHWTVDGEYIDDSGRRVQGRDAIADMYTAFFAANPGARLTTQIDGLRLINDTTAIEDGTSSVDPQPAGAPASSRYTAVHVKQDGNWLMCSVQETRIEVPSNYAHLADLEFLNGTFVSEHNGIEFKMTGAWIANKNFLEQKFESRRGAHVVSSGTQLIGWDPRRQQITSWVFTSDGGHAMGLWSPHETGWIVETVGTTGDGTPTTAVNTLTALDDQAYAWRSVNRTAGGFRVLDTEELIIKRLRATQ
jgi:uncharacterized protein (TIGR02246 family)